MHKHSPVCFIVSTVFHTLVQGFNSIFHLFFHLFHLSNFSYFVQGSNLFFIFQTFALLSHRWRSPVLPQRSTNIHVDSQYNRGVINHHSYFHISYLSIYSCLRVSLEGNLKTKIYWNYATARKKRLLLLNWPKGWLSLNVKICANQDGVRKLWLCKSNCFHHPQMWKYFNLGQKSSWWLSWIGLKLNGWTADVFVTCIVIFLGLDVAKDWS